MPSMDALHLPAPARKVKGLVSFLFRLTRLPLHRFYPVEDLPGSILRFPEHRLVLMLTLPDDSVSRFTMSDTREICCLQIFPEHVHFTRHARVVAAEFRKTRPELLRIYGGIP